MTEKKPTLEYARPSSPHHEAIPPWVIFGLVGVVLLVVAFFVALHFVHVA